MIDPIASSKGDYVDVRSTTLKEVRQTIPVVEWLFI